MPPSPPDPFRPSPHTGLLLATLAGARFPLGDGLDMGVGSGAVLAALGQAGVARLTGVDMDPDALAAARALLASEGLGDRARLLHGSLWDPLAGAAFDVVAANLPQFAAEAPADPEHSPYWSSAGADGRRLMDPFLAGLGAHLAPGGAAFVAHNVFLGRDRSEAIVAAQGLSCRAAAATWVLLHPAKAAMLDPGIRRAGAAAGLRRVGGYEFAAVEVLEIRKS